MRHSDRGPDNMNKTTHGAHMMFVREGMFDELYWGALESGHSHNSQVLVVCLACAVWWSDLSDKLSTHPTTHLNTGWNFW